MCDLWTVWRQWETLISSCWSRHNTQYLWFDFINRVLVHHIQVLSEFKVALTTQLYILWTSLKLPQRYATLKMLLVSIFFLTWTQAKLKKWCWWQTDRQAKALWGKKSIQIKIWLQYKHKWLTTTTVTYGEPLTNLLWDTISQPPQAHTLQPQRWWWQKHCGSD